MGLTPVNAVTATAWATSTVATATPITSTNLNQPISCPDRRSTSKSVGCVAALQFNASSSPCAITMAGGAVRLGQEQEQEHE